MEIEIIELKEENKRLERENEELKREIEIKNHAWTALVYFARSRTDIKMKKAIGDGDEYIYMGFRLYNDFLQPYDKYFDFTDENEK